jgi:hypothetical protein
MTTSAVVNPQLEVFLIAIGTRVDIHNARGFVASPPLVSRRQNTVLKS